LPGEKRKSKSKGKWQKANGKMMTRNRHAAIHFCHSPFELAIESVLRSVLLRDRNSKRKGMYSTGELPRTTTRGTAVFTIAFCHLTFAISLVLS
jgi:hypothetical protein